MELILHHYDISPYAEKVRLILGLKQLAWRSCIVPMTLPKPMLMPLTGGFRRTPVLQIGADIYCDTLRIAMELDRRYPEPPVLPSEHDGMIQMLSTWAERVLMWPTSRYVTGLNRGRLDAAFFADRAAMRGHAPPDMDAVAEALPHQRAQLKLMLGWIENLLADGRDFLVISWPTLGDFAVYQRLWWLQAFDGKAADVLQDYAAIRNWMARIADIGHGERREITPEEAMAVGRKNQPAMGDAIANGEGQERVSVATEDFGPDPVEGTLVHATADEISLRRDDPDLGAIHVHFPRLGYEITSD